MLSTWIDQPKTSPQTEDSPDLPSPSGANGGSSGGISWPQFLTTYTNQLSDFLVKRRDDSICFFHPLFREWLIRRADKDSVKFVCDPRQGHMALALAMCRGGGAEEKPGCGNQAAGGLVASQLGPEKSLELAHHILKSNIYK